LGKASHSPRSESPRLSSADVLQWSPANDWYTGQVGFACASREARTSETRTHWSRARGLCSRRSGR